MKVARHTSVKRTDGGPGKPARRPGYTAVLKGLAALVDQARQESARAVNTVMTATYWEMGRRIVEHEQGGKRRAGYGDELLERLSKDLGERFGRGFSRRNIEQMRAFFLTWPIPQTVSAVFKKAGKARAVELENPLMQALSEAFPLPWSHYVRLLTVEDDGARSFYEKEALLNGWSVRQLDRQVATRYYERTGASRRKRTTAAKNAVPAAGRIEEAMQEPYILEFLDLKDEYSESDLEAALVGQLEHFLLELGSDFAFVGRQRRLRVGKEWYRIDLLFFHRRLRCLVIIDLKVGRFTHADAGQMNLYLNYAAAHWTHAEENPPVGLILCTERDDAVARYSLGGLPNSVLAREYRIALPKEKKLEEVVVKARRQIEKKSR
ncbi:MAG: DUF1016 family protein [Flavobacteriales bacterium]|nr:DUF1016 family protein [Flavobacteriales bacterium]